MIDLLFLPKIEFFAAQHATACHLHLHVSEELSGMLAVHDEESQLELSKGPHQDASKALGRSDNKLITLKYKGKASILDIKYVSQCHHDLQLSTCVHYESELPSAQSLSITRVLKLQLCNLCSDLTRR